MYAFKKETKAKSGELILSGHSDNMDITVDWKLAFNIPPRSLASSPHIAVLYAEGVDGQRDLAWLCWCHSPFFFPASLFIR